MSDVAKILILEDDRVLRDSLEDVLILAGHKVVSFESTDAIGDISNVDQFEIILLDLNLPVEDGIDFAQRVRANNQNIGIIIHSARMKGYEIKAGYGVGADIYIPKPASMNEICNAVNSLNARIKNTRSSDVSFLSYNSRNNLLSTEKKDVELTQKQSALLISFIRAKDNTLETWQIAEILALDLDDLSKSNVELHVSRLRQKIAIIAPNQKSLVSLRGYGYRLTLSIKIDV